MAICRTSFVVALKALLALGLTEEDLAEGDHGLGWQSAGVLEQRVALVALGAFTVLVIEDLAE